MNEHPERPTANPSDELLAIRCQLGERDAFDELIERYADRLRGYVRRFSNQASETDDLVQDIWLRVLRALPGLREPARLRAWIFSIAHRVIVDRLRSRYAEPVAASADELVDQTDVQVDHLQRDQIERGLATLAPPPAGSCFAGARCCRSIALWPVTWPAGSAVCSLSSRWSPRSPLVLRRPGWPEARVV